MKNLIICILSGAILPLAFAPFNWSIIAFLSPLGLLYVWRQSSPLKALWYGWLFGIALFSAGVYWVYISIHNFGNANIPLAALITILFIMTMGIFPAIQGALFSLFSKYSPIASALFAFPALWVISEWARSWVFSGFPWLYLGYTGLHNSFGAFAPFVGVYGISLSIVLISSSLYVFFLTPSKKLRILTALIVVILFGLSLIAQATHHFASPTLNNSNKSLIKVSLIQGNLGQQFKWEAENITQILNRYQSLTDKNWGSDIIVWPEAAIPRFPEQVAPFLTQLNRKAKREKTTIILGIPIYESNTGAIYNGLLSIGNGKGVYLKQHLVPFGEYIPLKSIFSWAFDYLNIPLSSLHAAKRQQEPVTANGIPFAPFICYEIAFPIEVLHQIKNRQFIVVLSDDSWFGDSIASAQQLQMAQMRAKELHRYILYATNTGITAIIKPDGSLQNKAPINKTTVLNGTIQPLTTITPLMQVGYYPILIIILIFLILALLPNTRKKR